MSYQIQELINKTDNSELIGLKIVDILKTESTQQQVLATDESEDPNDWKLRVFYERANPWEQFLNNPSDDSPLVNVWMDNTNYLQRESNEIEYQKAETVYNIDIYGYGKASADGSGGQNSGDKVSSETMQRGLRLVRNILMFSGYTYLGMRGVVSNRWPQSITVYQPQLDNNMSQQVIACRLAFRVRYLEYSPQYVPQDLDIVFNTVLNQDSEVLMEVEYDYT